jgi:hypothetical protein
VYVNNVHDGLSTRVDSSPPVAIDDYTCVDSNDSHVNFNLNYLFTCLLFNCTVCSFIRSSFISNLHFNLGFISLGNFLNNSH